MLGSVVLKPAQALIVNWALIINHFAISSEEINVILSSGFGLFLVNECLHTNAKVYLRNDHLTPVCQGWVQSLYSHL